MSSVDYLIQISLHASIEYVEKNIVIFFKNFDEYAMKAGEMKTDP